MPDALHQHSPGVPDDLGDERITALAVFGPHFHFHQFVLFQHAVQFSQEGRAGAFVAHLEQGTKVVCLSAQETVLGGGQGDGHALRYGRRRVFRVSWSSRPSTNRQGAIAITGTILQPCADLPMATRSKSSQRWLREHFSDPFVKKAQAEGMRSRAAYKLEELLERDRLLKPGMLVVDLGAAPGGWSQYVRKAMGDGGRVVALDILEMPPLAGVEFLHGDFREDEVLSQLKEMLNGQPVDLVLSDMAPNKSGVEAVDQPRAMYLAELAMAFADDHLRPGGAFLIKLFQGTGFDDYVRELRTRYDKVVIRKPEASRKRSPEVYALGRGKRARAV